MDYRLITSESHGVPPWEQSKQDGQTYLKLFYKKDWIFVPIHLNKTDVRYLEKYWQHTKRSAPVLERKHGKWFLRFSFTEHQKLSETDVSNQRICAVDLGVNTDATCCIMTSDGTILARKFIDFPSDKDQLYRVLNRIKGVQQKYPGKNKNVRALWAYATRLNDELSKEIASAIVDFAVSNNADCIVFEHLDMRGKKLKGSKAQRLSLWRKNGIQDLVEHKAHRCGIHISRICAWGTSKLAFDGSGELTRNEHNHSLATFSSGKCYNCDLSACYNIGARYFVRETLKSLPEKVESQLLAEVPDAGRRTKTTLKTLWQVASVLPELQAA